MGDAVAEEYEIVDEAGNRIALIRKTKAARRETAARYIQVMIAGLMIIGLALWGAWTAFVR